jgi:hypothetical protein
MAWSSQHCRGANQKKRKERVKADSVKPSQIFDMATISSVSPPMETKTTVQADHKHF